MLALLYWLLLLLLDATSFSDLFIVLLCYELVKVLLEANCLVCNTGYGLRFC